MPGRSLLVVTAYVAALAVPTAAQAAVGPTNLRVTEVRASGATLAWDAPTGGAQVYGYGIHDVNMPATGSQVGWSFTTTGTATLTPRTERRLVVRALLIVDGQLVDSRPSNIVTVTTPADSTPPTAPHARAETQTATTATISFAGSTDDVGVDSWVISDGTRTWTQPAWMQWRLTATGLETNRSHTLTVRARDAAGNLSPSSNALTFALENQPPTAPANLRVEEDELVWDASTDNATVAGYLVFVDGDAQPFAETGATRTPLRFCDDELNPTFCFPSLGEPHTYVVRARDSSRNLSPPSEPLVVLTG